MDTATVDINPENQISDDFRQLNIKEIIRVILSQKRSLDFQRKFDFPKIIVKKKDEKIKHFLSTLIRERSIDYYVNHLIENNLYVSKFGLREIDNFLKNSNITKHDARAKVG